MLAMGAGRSREVEAVGTGEKPSEVIRKARGKLTLVLQEDPGAVLSAVDTHLLLSQGEYFSLSQIDDPQKLIATLIDTILEKGELAHESFLNCLANLQYTFSGLEPISKYLGDDSNSGPVHPEGAGFLDKKNEPDDPEIMASSVRKGLPGSPSAGIPSKERRDKSSEDATTSLEEKKGAEGLEDTASPSEKGKRAKTLEDEAMPSEKKRSMSPEGATIPSKERMGAEVSRNVIAPLEKRPGAKTTEVVATTSEEGKGQENLEEVTTTSDNGNRGENAEGDARLSEKGCSEAPEQFLQQTQEELTALWSLGNTLELTPVGDELPESTPVKKQEEATPLRTSAIGTLVKTSAGEKTLGKPSDIIRKERKRLIEILLRDLELSLDEFISQSIITEEEYETLDKAEEDLKKKSRKLLILVQKKGESTCQKFLECLKIVSPGLDEELQYLSYVEGADTPRVPERAEGDLLKDTLIQEQEDEIQQATELEPKGRRKAGGEVISKLKLRKYKNGKLRLSDILDISPGSIQDQNPQALGDLPWHFLRKVMALNVTARSMSLVHGALGEQGDKDHEEQGIEETIFCLSNNDREDGVNPLDVVCAVLRCSDSFLQQEILSKMAMCQFALPLLLPALDTPKCTLLLWAMRDIVKKWRPRSLAESRGFREESLVLTQMPTISFVRLQHCNLSKSKLLNEILSPAQQHHDFFVHRDMASGNVPRAITNGLVEISWYFPGGRETLDVFPEPVAVTNLRGDVASHWPHFSFLTEVSSAVFIFAESITEREYGLLSSLRESTTKYYFILNHQARHVQETLGFLKKLSPVLKLKSSHVLMKDETTNIATFVKKLHTTILGILKSAPKKLAIQDMAVTARELGIHVDEDRKECLDTSKCIDEITREIRDVARYKKEMLRLQGDLWRNLAKVEKELCRMARQGDTPSEKYRSQLKEKMLEIRKQQNACDLTAGLTKFISGIGHLPQVEKQYFLKWMKFQLDSVARENLSKLRDTYKEKCKTLDDPQKLAQLDKLILSASLGVEHFMRELGQFYEAECSMVKERKIQKRQRQFTQLPGIAADLMLEGFPLELLDGDASNIPLQWVTDVLTQLHTRLRGRSRMVVLTVLGVQSTGKSTLLNTMFGLQFAVSSGRCTRGAFMLLIKIRENLKEELGCDFILVIDTEGLKAPELATLEDSYQHDNELATLVIGLSDITIVNMAMENATEMKDILQIAVHAFLRMGEIGVKPNCQFVHQNVSDVSAHEQNLRDRKRLLEQLNEMIKAAAKMEKLNKEITFSDIMDYDAEKHNWYVPGLWHGVPPMAPVNTGYSEKVFEFKKYLFEFIKSRSRTRKPKDVPQFIKWVESLWSAVKHENFIFSFRNSLVAEAYNQLCMQYAEWEWDFRKEVHLWVTEKETAIQNLSPTELEADDFQHAMQQKLLCGEKKILESLRQYFESGAANLPLIEKYREDFIRSAKGLKNELESYSFSKCKEAVHIKKGQHKIEFIQGEYLKVIEVKVDKLLDDCRRKQRKLQDKELEEEFEKMWKETLLELSPIRLKKRQIHEEMELHLRTDLGKRGSSVNQKIQGARSLLHYNIKSFQMQNEYLDSSWRHLVKDCINNERSQKTGEVAGFLLSRCSNYIQGRVASKADYDKTYCGELLHMINERLQQQDVQKLGISAHFEVDLKLHILGEASQAFQKMHEDFIKENDPQQHLEKLKPQYFSIFRDHYLEKDARENRARDFCNQCLKPAFMDYVNKRLGLEIVDDFLSSGQSIEYASRSFFQFTVLKKLLEDGNFNRYAEYISNYEKFVKDWIRRHILDHYRRNEDLEDLEKDILSSIIKKVRDALEIPKYVRMNTISGFLENFCKVLKKDLVISKDSLVGIQFKNTADPHQFAACIQSFLPDLQQQVLSELKRLDVSSKLSKLPLKPQEEIFKRVFGCGNQCPFCKVPCEAGGAAHEQHFASVHRPQGLGGYRCTETEKLIYSLCSSDVVSNTMFKNSDTDWKYHPYKDYHQYYPHWRIQPDPSINASDYWKFVFKESNEEFAKRCGAKPADLPTDWQRITKEQALGSLREIFNIK